MKLVIIVLSVLTIIGVSTDSETDVGDALDELEKACTKQTGATPAEVQSVANMEVPQTRPAECLAACMAKGFGLMSDNKLNMERVKKMEFEPALQGALEVCAHITDADECTAAKLIMKCTKQHY